MPAKSMLPLILVTTLLCHCLASAAPAAPPDLKIMDLRCEYRTNPLGMDILRPRLSWKIKSARRNVLQTAYELRFAGTAEELAKGRSTGKITSGNSTFVVYDGPALQSRQRVYWQVRVWDDAGAATGWSEAAWWEMGLLKTADWQAQWIHADIPEDLKKSCPAPMLRHEFTVDKPVRSARAYVTSLGLYEMALNGKRTGDQVLTPFWTAYDDILQYQTYDITGDIKQGKNAIGVMLGDGWFRGFLVWAGNRNVYGDKLALICQLEITYADGTGKMVVSGKDWKAATGPILASDIYNGETYDARLEKKGWTEAGFDAAAWKGINILKHSKKILCAQAGPPVRRIQTIKPIKLLKTPEGDTVVDMGQNMVGWVRLKVRGKAGTRITIRHAEVLDKAGNFYTENLRAAKQTNVYILKGEGEEVYAPHFTFQGFRYVAIDGYPGELTPDKVAGIVVHSDYATAGKFTCSDPMINQLQHNIQWGQKGNFLDVPTDCPQRDERLGWTGDAQVFVRTACFNGDVAGFFTKWLKDLAADQQSSGAVPHVIPNVITHGKDGGWSAACGWADACTIIPWTIYLCYGDRRILENQYDSMSKWVAYVRKKAGGGFLWTGGEHFGDWLAFNTERSDYPGATTDKDLLATAFFARSTALLQKTAEVLGKTDEAADLAQLLKNIKKAFAQEYITPNGRLMSNTQTAYAMALAFDLVPDALKAKTAGYLAADVNKFKHITTGFLGAPLICHVLSDHGYYKEAFMLLTRKKYPSWLYPITQGATTIWERWDGQKPDGTFQNKGMNSFNHYAYGAIGEWLYRVVAGIEIDPEKPGYKHIIIQPHPGGGLTHARASHESMYGTIVSGWAIKDGRLTLDVTIPPNTTATVKLPAAGLDAVTEGGKKLDAANGIKKTEQSGKTVVISIGSGQYRFSCPCK